MATSLGLGRVTDFKVGFEPQVTAIAMVVSGGLGVVFGFFAALAGAYPGHQGLCE